MSPPSSRQAYRFDPDSSERRRYVASCGSLRSLAWTLAQLLALVAEDSFPIDSVAPWRAKQPLTAGLIAQWLRIEVTGLPFRVGFDRKSQEFSFPEQRGDPRLRW